MAKTYYWPFALGFYGTFGYGDAGHGDDFVPSLRFNDGRNTQFLHIIGI